MNSAINRMVDMANGQDWPTGALYVVATPIGNMADMTVRAAIALQKADAIAAEDTRKTKILCEQWGITTPILMLHKHNERLMSETIIERLDQGQRIALVSDAGTPCVSDPGALLVRAVQAKGKRVVPLPGPCAATTAYMALGANEAADSGFIFIGFPPAAEGARKQVLLQYLESRLPVIFYIAPHDIRRVLLEIAGLFQPGRRVTIGRELTKRFEAITSFTIEQTATWLEQQETSESLRGEFVVILEPAEHTTEAVLFTPELEKIVAQMVKSLSVKDTAQILSELTPYRSKALYDLALQIKKQNS